MEEICIPGQKIWDDRARSDTPQTFDGTLKRSVWPPSQIPKGPDSRTAFMFRSARITDIDGRTPCWQTSESLRFVVRRSRVGVFTKIGLVETIGE